MSISLTTMLHYLMRKKQHTECGFEGIRKNSSHKIIPLCFYLLSASRCPSHCRMNQPTPGSPSNSTAVHAVLRTKSHSSAWHSKSYITRQLLHSGLLLTTSFTAATLNSGFQGWPCSITSLCLCTCSLCLVLLMPM